MKCQPIRGKKKYLKKYKICELHIVDNLNHFDIHWVFGAHAQRCPAVSFAAPIDGFLVVTHGGGGGAGVDAGAGDDVGCGGGGVLAWKPRTPSSSWAGSRRRRRLWAHHVVQQLMVHRERRAQFTEAGRPLDRDYYAVVRV